MQYMPRKRQNLKTPLFPFFFMDKPAKILVFGTFDVIHEGHIDFFRQAKEQKKDAELVVIVARDVNVEKAKGKPKNNEETRLKEVKKAHHVNEAMLGETDDKLKVIERIAPDIICLGYDQEAPEDLEDQLRKRGIKVKVIRLKPYREEEFKSSRVK